MRADRRTYWTRSMLRREQSRIRTARQRSAVLGILLVIGVGVWWMALRQPHTAVTIIWSRHIGSDVPVAPGASDKLLLVPGADGDLHALDNLTSRLVWRFTCDFALTSSPSTNADTVCFASSKPSLYALDIRNGSKRWEFLTQGYVATTPLIVANPPSPPVSGLPLGIVSYHSSAAGAPSGTVYAGSDEGVLYAIDLTSGRLRWQLATEQAIASSPSQHNGIVFFGCNDHRIYALDARTGVRQWLFATGGSVLGASHVAHGRVYVGSDDHCMYALEPQTGRMLWKARTHGIIRCQASSDDHAVYVGSNDGNLYAFEPATGTVLWKYRAGDAIRCTPTVVPPYVFCGTDTGLLAAVDAATGEQFWQYHLQSPIRRAILVSEGILVAVTEKGTVTALQVP